MGVSGQVLRCGEEGRGYRVGAAPVLFIKADSLEDKAALSAIQESQHRVQATALIHQKLYQAEGVARILMSDYIEEVVVY